MVKGVLEMQKKKLFILMTDLDGTIIPADLDQMKALALVLKKIGEDKKIDVKFCPISGRPSAYVLSVMDVYETIFKKLEGRVSLGYGAAELGSIILEGKDNPFGRIYLQSKESYALADKIRTQFAQSPYAKYFNADPDGHFVTAFVIKPQLYRNLSPEKRLLLYQELRDYLRKEQNHNLDIVFSGCIEIKPKGVSKEKAIQWMLERYQKEYDVRGIVYCADSENDKKAVEYMVRLGMIPGIRAHVFLPSNAMQIIHSEQIEAWKTKFEKFGLKKNVKISHYSVSEGITDLLYQHLNSGELITQSKAASVTRDDSTLTSSKARF